MSPGLPVRLPGYLACTSTIRTVCPIRPMFPASSATRIAQSGSPSLVFNMFPCSNEALSSVYDMMKDLGVELSFGIRAKILGARVRRLQERKSCSTHPIGQSQQSKETSSIFFLWKFMALCLKSLQGIAKTAKKIVGITAILSLPRAEDC